MRVGIAHHFGWAIAVTATADHRVVDRRRIELVEPGVVDLGLIVERMGAGAKLFGLEPATIAPDAEANIALVDLSAEWEAGADGWESRSSNSCFNGRRMRSQVLMTIVGGGVAFRRRRFAVRAA